VTSSSASTGGIATGTGLPPQLLQQVTGVVKAYATRVGTGPFPTEQDNEYGNRLREAGREYGSTTGRPRRCGWFDAVAVRYSCEVSGATALALTNLDVLAGIEQIPVAVAYELGGARTERFPAFDVEAARPVWREFAGFTGDLRGVRRFGDLPAAARTYVEAIERLVQVPIRIVSVGPERDQVILR
jgi:adenylosuccinate synthase